MSDCCKNELLGIIEPGVELEGCLEAGGELEGELESVIYANDHTRLRNRDMPNQHPISAITGLQEELDSKISGVGTIIIYCGTSTEVIDGV